MKKSLQKKPEDNLTLRGTKRDTETYTKIMNSLTSCPFCELKKKYVIKKTDHLVLTVNIFPYTDGHMLIIPKRHVEKVCDFTPLEWEELHVLINHATSKAQKVLGVLGFDILCQEGPNSGSSLTHSHFHIVPCKTVILEKNLQEIHILPLEFVEKTHEN